MCFHLPYRATFAAGYSYAGGGAGGVGGRFAMIASASLLSMFSRVTIYYNCRRLSIYIVCCVLTLVLNYNSFIHPSVLSNP